MLVRLSGVSSELAELRVCDKSWGKEKHLFPKLSQCPGATKDKCDCGVFLGAVTTQRSLVTTYD